MSRLGQPIPPSSAASTLLTEEGRSKHAAAAQPKRTPSLQLCIAATVCVTFAVLLIAQSSEVVAIHGQLQLEFQEQPKHVHASFENASYTGDVKLTMVDAIRRASRSGGLPLGGGLFLFGILWPFVQLAALLILALLVHFGQLDSGTRRTLVSLLVPLSKWSLFGILFVSSASVIVDVTSPPNHINVKIATIEGKDIREDIGHFIYEVHLKCLPSLALFCLAIVSATAVVHWAEHEIIAPLSSRTPSESTGLLQELCSDLQENSHESHGQHSDNTLPVALATMALLVVGASRTLVSIERSGYSGKALLASADREVSVMGMMKDMFSAPHLRVQPTVVIMAVLLLILVLVAPLMELMLLVQAADRHARGRSQKRALALRLYGLDCLEVFLVSTVLLVTNLDQVMTNEANQHCNRALFNNEELMDRVGFSHMTHDKCLEETLRLGTGWWLLLAAVLFRNSAWHTSNGEASLIASAFAELCRAIQGCWSRAAPVILRPEAAPVAVNIVLLLVGHLWLYMHVKLTVDAPVMGVPDQTLAPLNFITTVENAVRGGAYLMAVAVALLVVAWPYVKLLSTFAVVSCVRTKNMTKDAALHVLEGMNIVAKWSFVEVFFFCMAAMATSMESPKHKVNLKVNRSSLFSVRVDAGDFSFDSFVELLPGSMVMICAIVLVTGFTHWHVHELDPPQPKQAAGATRQNDSMPALIATSGALLFLVMGVGQSVLMLDRKGFLGKALGERSEVDISLYNMISMLTHQHFLKEQLTIQILAAMAALLAVVSPTLEMIFLMASLHWAESRANLSCQVRRIAEWLYSFDCVEVFLFTCTIILIDFDRFISFMLKDECLRLRYMMTRKNLDKVGLLHLYDKDCITIESQLGIGFWLLLVAVMLRSIAWRLARKPLHKGSEEASAMIDSPGARL